ncbi:MAG: hypothetical protein Q8L88_09890 [Bacteroidota bacterium]|nr:hypothetical protein [Bacteroidota bacterium]
MSFRDTKHREISILFLIIKTRFLTSFGMTIKFTFEIVSDICYFIIFIFLVLVGCDKGLTPVSNTVISPGFSGTITYKSPFPPTDSLIDLRIVAVPYYPVDTLFQDILLKVFSGEIAYSPNKLSTLDSGATASYEMLVTPKTYYYIAVVQQYGPSTFSQWRVVGVYGYSLASPTPKTVIVTDNKFISGINIDVDFYNLPPQPFK